MDKIRYTKNDIVRNGFDDDLIINREDAELFIKFSDYMKGKSDLDDVQSDPQYLNTTLVVKDMLSFYSRNTTCRENESFIRSSLTDRKKESTLTNEIANIKFEINENELNEITSEWVKEWHRKKQEIGLPDPKTEEIRSFITDAINSSVNESQPAESSQKPISKSTLKENIVESVNEDREKILAFPRKSRTRSLIIRYSSLAAAALIGVFLLLRTLIPSTDTAHLFDSNYKPFDAMSTITRGSNTQSAYSNAIAQYKSGDYQTASVGFADVLKTDPYSVSAKFFIGLSHLALNNLNEAENNLSAVVNNAGEFGKEAKWYLGLTYLENGNKQKAAECFEYLAGTKGYYAERSEKILRRLR